MNNRMSRTVRDKAYRAARKWSNSEGEKLTKWRDSLILLASVEGLVIIVLTVVLFL